MTETTVEQVRLPLRPKHCTVLGYRIKHHTQPLWAGLYLDLAEVKGRASVMVAVLGSDAPQDVHLSVPWQHPDDRRRFGRCDDEYFYRVRSRYRAGGRYSVKRNGRRTWRAVEHVSFDRDEDRRWFIVLTLRARAASIPVREIQEESHAE